jgi:hypothetical protein
MSGWQYTDIDAKEGAAKTMYWGTDLPFFTCATFYVHDILHHAPARTHTRTHIIATSHFPLPAFDHKILLPSRSRTVIYFMTTFCNVMRRHAHRYPKAIPCDQYYTALNLRVVLTSSLKLSSGWFPTSAYVDVSRDVGRGIQWRAILWTCGVWYLAGLHFSLPPILS